MLRLPTAVPTSLAALAALLLAATATAQEPAPDAAPATADLGPPVLRIDGVDVPSAVFDTWLVRERGEQLLDQYALRTAVRQRAAERGIELDRAAAEAALDAEIGLRLENAFGGDRARWEAELAIGGRTVEGYRRERLLELEFLQLATALAAVDRVVPEAKIVREWEKRYGPEGRTMSVRALQRRVTITTRPGATSDERREAKEAADAAAREELEGYRERMLAGEEFALLASRHSDDAATRAAGGLIEGSFRPAGWPAAVVGALTSATPGEVTEPLAARGGWWLFQVVSARVTPLDEVRGELEAALIAAGPEDDEVGAEVRAIEAELTVEGRPPLEAPDLTTPEGRAATAAVVNGVEIPVRRYADWLRAYRGEQQAPAFAERWLVRAAAEEAGVEQPSSEAIEARIDEELGRTLQMSDASEQEWLGSLAAKGLTEENWRRATARRARLDLLCEALLQTDRLVTDAQVRSLWIDRYGADGRAIEARLIAQDVDVEPRGDHESQSDWERRVEAAAEPAMEQLAELRGRVLDGEDFGALAQRYSTDRESRPLGGVPPGGFDVRAYPETVRQTLVGLPLGEVTEPLLLDTRVLIFEITEVRDVPFESVRDALREELLTTPASRVRVSIYRNQLLQAATVERLPALYR